MYTEVQLELVTLFSDAQSGGGVVKNTDWRDLEGLFVFPNEDRSGSSHLAV